MSFSNSKESIKTKWKLDSKNKQFITGFKEKIKKISSGIVLTENGDVYLNETWKILSNVFDIVTSENRFGGIFKNGNAFYIDKKEFKNFEEKIIYFRKERITKIDIIDSMIESELSEMKESKPRLLKCYRNKIYSININGELFSGTTKFQKESSINIGNQKKFISIDVNSKGILLICDKRSKYLLNDIPNEMLKCRYCQNVYQKDLNTSDACEQMCPSSYHEFY
eukprot:gene3521-6168_t